MFYDRGTGWTEWDLPNFRNRISYIDDFPYTVLKALVKYFKYGEEQNVVFDAEMVVYSFTISSKVTAGETVIYESTVDFANDFICELEKSLESWSHFPIRRTGEEDYRELVDLIVEVRTQLMDDDLIEKWIEINS